jgi:septal ring factor EnvC (AmiA/AmiB activator)
MDYLKYFKSILIKFFEELIEDLKILFHELRNKTSFILNKQATIQKMYRPLLNNKIEENNKLEHKIKTLKKQNKDIQDEINIIQTRNVLLKNEISVLEKLIVNNSDQIN